jgi:dihydroorotate dehydrogenase
MITLPFDIYPYIRPIFFHLDPEVAHDLVLKFIRMGLATTVAQPKDPVLATNLCGLPLPHPVGLAAGFDKNAEVINDLYTMGFSFVELGAVTPLAQPGNPKPRMFRIPAMEAVINRFGFNNVGADTFTRHLIAYRDGHRAAKSRVLGVNVGKNKATENAVEDYVKGIRAYAHLAEFITVNVSSPNTPGLRDMQERGALTELLRECIKTRNEAKGKAKLLLKIAPDVTDEQAKDIAAVALDTGIDAMIVSNTTISRPAALPADMAQQAGGLSGRPLFDMSTKLLGRIYQLTEGKLPLDRKSTRLNSSHNSESRMPSSA